MTNQEKEIFLLLLGYSKGRIKTSFDKSRIRLVVNEKSWDFDADAFYDYVAFQKSNITDEFWIDPEFEYLYSFNEVCNEFFNDLNEAYMEEAGD